MSDDTPTQKFDPTGDTPNERFTAPAGETVPLEVVEERASRKLTIILASIGGVLLLAVLIVLIVLLTRGTGVPTAPPTPTGSSASPTPTPSASTTPTASPTPTQAAPPPPPPPSTDVSVDSLTAHTTSECSSQTQNRVNVEIAWESTNGIAAYFGINTADAETSGMGWTLPPSGNSNDFPNGYVPFQFQCGNVSNSYTITVVGNGSKASKTITVENTGDQF